MPETFIPTREDQILAWSNNFATRIAATPTAFGLVVAQATAMTAANTAWATSLAAAQNPTTRGPATILAKDEAKRNMIALARTLARQVQGTQSVTDAQRQALGLTIHAVPTPTPIPSVSPFVEIQSTIGRTAKVRLWDPASNKKRGFPKGCRSCTVFSHVGPAAPTELSAWKFEGSSTRNIFELLFPASVPAGATVWVTAFYANARMQSGPAATPVSCNLPGGNVVNLAA